MINPNEPVRLRNSHRPVRGKVTEIGANGLLTVEFENGSRGQYAANALEPFEDKTWPPTGLETKTPYVEVK